MDPHTVDLAADAGQGVSAVDPDRAIHAADPDHTADAQSRIQNKYSKLSATKTEAPTATATVKLD